MKHQIDLNAIPKEKLRFAQLDAKLSDTKFEDKPIGYFHDAWIRFRKNKASVVATVIIILIVLFAFVVPVFTRNHMGVMDTYYAKKGPRHTFLKESLGIADGGVTGSYSEVDFIRNVGIGVGAEDTDGKSVKSFKETFGTLYQPLNELISMEESVNKISKKSTIRFNAEFDCYLQVGFIYKSVTQKEYQNILDYQNATGLQILYPLVENNEWNPDATDANYWYKCDKKYNPVTVNEKGKATKLTYSEDLVLEDNYMRDDNGEVMYWQYAGGGTFDTAHYKIRILYYNYYYYLHDFFPNYIFGTDAQGYDLALRMAQGIQLSLLVAVGVSVINMVIGAIYGAIEGYYGGAVDLILERISDILSYVPFIIVMTLFQMHLAAKVGPIVSLLLGYVSIGWIGMAYRVRTQFYRFKTQEYVLAAHTL
ncbi:MAG: ABC transporter permease, partial [Erysipelotrichaceae bacterium]|nr:ABC transporter permease [Erysipelotrichaceae bacterium]